MCPIATLARTGGRRQVFVDATRAADNKEEGCGKGQENSGVRTSSWVTALDLRSCSRFRKLKSVHSLFVTMSTNLQACCGSTADRGGSKALAGNAASARPARQPNAQSSDYSFTGRQEDGQSRNGDQPARGGQSRSTAQMQQVRSLQLRILSAVVPVIWTHSENGHSRTTTDARHRSRQMLAQPVRRCCTAHQAIST